MQAHLAAAWRREGLAVTQWAIDVAEMERTPGFPGMEVPRSAALGVTARWPGGGAGPTLLLNGHTDVVPPGDRGAWRDDPFNPSVVEHNGAMRMYGRGACDMKGGIVAAWEAVRAVRDAGVTLGGDVVLAPVSGEEDGGLGTFALLASGFTADACIICEPTGLDLIPANAGALTFRLRVRGRAAHASRRTDGVSALDKFVGVLQALHELERRRNATVDPRMAGWPVAYPLSIGVVRAGDWASSVPDLLLAEGRLGVALGESVDEARASLEDAVADACSSDRWLRDNPVAVEWWGGQFAAAATDPSAPVVTALRAAHTERTSLAPRTYGAPFGSDLRLLVGIGGIPTVLYGPGDSTLAHAADECIDLDQVALCAEVLADTIVDFCGRA